MYASVKEPQVYDTPKDQPLINFGAEGGATYDNKEGQVYDNKGNITVFFSLKNVGYNYTLISWL